MSEPTDNEQPVTLSFYGYDLPDNRKVQGHHDVTRDSWYWIFTNNGVETRLALSGAAMEATMLIYAHILRAQIRCENAGGEWKVTETP